MSMIKNPTLSGSANGTTQQQYGTVNFKAWSGIQDGNGNFTPGASFRLDGEIQQYTSPEFLNDDFGTIETATTDNFVYQASPRVAFGEANFQADQQNANLVYPSSFTVNVSLQNLGYATGYKVSDMTYRTCEEGSKYFGICEASLAKNRRQLAINKTIYMIAVTCLATGNFKVIKGLEATDTPPQAGTVDPFRQLRNAIVAYKKKGTTTNQGIPENYRILFSNYTMQGALDQVGQTSITASEKAFTAYTEGEVLKGYGFNIVESEWLGCNYLWNDNDGPNLQKLTQNCTTVNYDFTNISALLYTPDSIKRFCKAPRFAYDGATDLNGFFPASGADKTALITDYGRIYQFTLDVFIEALKEAMNMLILNKAPSQQEVLNARILLATTYPIMYSGINPENGYMVGDTDGSKTKAMINQGLTASQKYVYSPDSIPQDSNVYGFNPQFINTNGITKSK